MKDVYVQSSPCNLISLWLPIGGSETQVHRLCPSRAPRAARSPHWRHAIRQRREGVSPQQLLRSKTWHRFKPKIEGWEHWAKEIRPSATTCRIKSSPPPPLPLLFFFYSTKFNLFLFHLFLSPSPVELSLSLSASASQPYVAVLTRKFLTAFSFRTFFPHTCLPFVSPIIHHAEAAPSLLLFGRQSMRLWFSSTPVHNLALAVRQLSRALYYRQL